MEWIKSLDFNGKEDYEQHGRKIYYYNESEDMIN